jgi:2-dehydro-3-deoxygalactonokinase
MIGVDWGPNLFRAWRIGADGAIRDRRISQRGLLSVPDQRFGDTLREELGRWIAGGEDRIVTCGPVRAWRPAPTISTPCGAAELAAASIAVPFDWAKVRLVPAIRHDNPTIGPSETPGGEETYLVGAAAAIGGSGLLCMPGPVSCWARVEGGRITGLTTHVTGEAFMALRGPVLGRASRETAVDPDGFDRGVALSGMPGGMLRQLAALRGDSGQQEPAACLLGLLVGCEVRAALTTREEVHLVGPYDHTPLYGRAIAACAGTALPPVAEAAAAGLALIGALMDW